MGIGDTKIEKGIPTPTVRGEVQDFLERLDIGDSFLSDVNNYSAAAERIKIKLVCRRQEDGRFRIWRVK